MGTRWQRYLALVALAFLNYVGPMQARVNVVSLPGRNSTQLTIYNSVDLTLVRETRVLTFKKGLNRLEFSWANTLIDPTSLEIRPLQHAEEIEVLDVSFPPRVSETLEWRIQSDFAGEAAVEIRYFTSGITWSADYVAEATRDEKAMQLSGFVRVTNNSGEDYENAQVRLIVGIVRLVEPIEQLARQARRDKTPMTKMLKDSPNADYFYRGVERLEERAGREAKLGAVVREVTKEGLSEYFLYTVGGRDNLPTGWSKRLPSFTANDVPLTSYYKYEKEIWGERVMRYYRFTNNIGSKLGKEPLPDGMVKGFRLASDDGLYAFSGNTTIKYIPIDETVDMAMGPDQEVSVKPTLMNWVKTDVQFDQNGNVKGWTIKERWEIEVQNSKQIAVVVDVRRNFSGDWGLETEAQYEKTDSDTARFILPLSAGEKRTVRYEVSVRYGTNATK